MLKIFFNERRLQIVLSVLILVPAVFISYSLVAEASLDDVVFPVTELGNCGDEVECRAYCDNSENVAVCLTVAEKYGLMSQEEIVEAKQFAALGVGPGGCTGKEACENYCEDANHIEECVTFAEANGLMSPNKLAEAKKLQTALRQGAKLPGGCSNKQSCDNYCGDPSHMEECVTFAEAAGFIPADELEDAKKMLQALKKGVEPPPCQGKEECDSYCAEPGNFEKCINFAEAAGFVSKEDADRARKTGGKGPGDCKSKEECNAFCENPDNGEACFNFAKEHGLISEKDLKRMEDGRQKMAEGLNQAPTAVVECLKLAVGGEVLDKINSGSVVPSQKLGEAMRGCFEKNMGEMGPPSGEGGGEGKSPGGFVGPGGCTSGEECKNYCLSNPEACQNFTSPAEPTPSVKPPMPDGQSSQELEGPMDFQPSMSPNLPEGFNPSQIPSIEGTKQFIERQFQERIEPPKIDYPGPQPQMQMQPQPQTQPAPPPPSPESAPAPSSEPPPSSSEPPPSGGNIFDVIRRFLSG
ncbi:MAG: hypothetical protein V2A55_01740 [Candidatus Jorgensenbacteria bacterium]